MIVWQLTNNAHHYTNGQILSSQSSSYTQKWHHLGIWIMSIDFFFIWPWCHISSNKHELGKLVSSCSVQERYSFSKPLLSYLFFQQKSSTGNNPVSYSITVSFLTCSSWHLCFCLFSQKCLPESLFRYRHRCFKILLHI